MGRKPDTRTPAIIEEIRRVADETGNLGKWKILATELNVRGVLSPRGAPWVATNLHQFCKRAGLIEGTPGKSLSAQTVPVQPDIDEPTPPPETYVPEEPEQITFTIPRDEDEEDSPYLTPSVPPSSAEREQGEAGDTPTEDLGPEPTTAIPQDTTAVVQEIPEIAEEAVEGAEEPPIPQYTTAISELDAETVATLREIVQWWRTGERQGEPVQTTQVERKERPLRGVFTGEKKNTGIRIDAKLLKAVQAKMRRPEERPRSGGKLSYLIEYLLWEYMGFDPKFQQ